MLYKIKEIVTEKGLLRGPFGGALKKEIFVPKGDSTYKVYEQGCVLNHNHKIGNYYISKEYFDKKMKNFEVLPGDILVSCSGVNYGAIYKMPSEMERGIINQALLRIRLREDVINPDYFCYLFENLISEIITTGSGDSTIPNFPPLSTIKEIEIDVPSLESQKQIAEFLNNYKKKIFLNNEMVSVLTNKIKDSYVHYVKNGPLQKEYLILDVLKFEKGVEPCQKTVSRSATHYYRVRDIGQNSYSDIEDDENLLKCDFGDIVYSLDGTIGKISYAVCGAISSGLYKVTSKINHSKVLIYSILTDELILKKLQYGSRSNTIIKHASSLLKNLYFSMSLNGIKKFCEENENYFLLCISLAEENFYLEEQKNQFSKMLLSNLASIQPH